MEDNSPEGQLPRGQLPGGQLSRGLLPREQLSQRITPPAEFNTVFSLKSHLTLRELSAGVVLWGDVLWESCQVEDVPGDT